MTRFELVKQVLDNLWGTVAGETDEDKIKAVKKALNSLTQQYSNIREVSEIDYSDPATQVAYIYTYTASHADILYKILDEANMKEVLGGKKKIKLTSFGGGPGSNMLGLMKFLEKKDFSQIEFIHNSCDKDDDWSFCWPSVLEQSSSDCKAFSKISASFHKVDVTEPQKKQRIDQFLQSDIFSLLYFTSEIISKKEEAREYFSHIFNNIAVGSIVVFIDNKMNDVIEYFKSFLSDKYEILLENHEDMRLSINEEKSALKEYMDKLNRSPKLTANVHYCVARKL